MSHEEASNPESLKNTQLSKSLMRRKKEVFFCTEFFLHSFEKNYGLIGENGESVVFSIL